MKRRVFYQMFFATLFGIVGLCGCQKKLRSEKDRNLSAIEEAQVMIESSMAESRSAERESQSKWAGQTEGVDYDFTKMGTELMQERFFAFREDMHRGEKKITVWLKISIVCCLRG